jgi:hypothetical protein
MKHTKGPWTIDDTGKYLQIRGNLSDRKHMAHEEVTAQVYHWEDAQLIAAAPELLAKLVEFIDVLENADINASGTNIDLESTLAEAKTLLAKIGGVT